MEKEIRLLYSEYKEIEKKAKLYDEKMDFPKLEFTISREGGFFGTSRSILTRKEYKIGENIIAGIQYEIGELNRILDKQNINDEKAEKYFRELEQIKKMSIFQFIFKKLKGGF